jgi:hypothetical protein
MHRLKRLASKDTNRIRDHLPADAKAGECLLKKMECTDWDMLESLNTKLGADDSLAPFSILRNWLVVGGLPIDSGQPEHTLSTAELRKEAKKLAKKIGALSRDIASLLPELADKDSLQMVILPEEWVQQTRSLNPTMQECYMEAVEYSQTGGKQLPQSPTVIDVLAGMAKASEGEDAAYNCYNEWSEMAIEVKEGIRGFCKLGVASPVAGQDSILEKIKDHIENRAHTIKTVRKPRNASAWYRSFCRELGRKIDAFPLFHPLQKNQKLRIIEICLAAYAEYHNQSISSSWGPREIDRSLD